MQERTKLSHSNLLRKYILYNVCLVLIPVAVLASVYYSATRKQAIREFETIHQYALSQTVESVDNQLRQFNIIASMIANDNKLTPFEICKTPYSQVVGIEKLHMYLSRSEFLENLLLYYYHDDFMYGSNGIYSLTTFSEHSYDFIGPWDYDVFYQMLYKNERLGTSPYQCYLRRKNDKDSAKLLVFTSSCLSSNFATYGTAVGLVKQDYFQLLLENLRSDLDSASYILDSKGRILFATRNNLDIDQQVIDNLFETGTIQETICSSIKINDESYSLLISKSSLNGWYYMTAIPHSQFLSRFIAAQKPVFTMLVFLSFAGLLLAFALAIINYHPIRKMSNSLDVGKLSKLTNNELTNISHAIQEIIASNRNMQLKLDESRQSIIENHLITLINGFAEGKQEHICETLKQAGVILKGPFYCVIALRLPAKQGIEIREYILTAIQTNSFINAYAIDSMYQSAITIIFSLQEPSNERQQFARYISDIVNDEYQIRPQIGVGLSYKSLSQINRSYFEAVTASESLPGENSYNIVFYDDLDKKKYTGRFWYPTNAQLRLYQGLRHGNSGIVCESIQEIRQLLLKLHLPSNSVRLRFMVSSIIIQLIPLIEEINLKDSDKIINSLIHYYSIDDFLSQLKDFCDKILYELERKKQEENDNLFHRIVSYIDNHYSNNDISLKQIANRYGVTPAFLSRFFKDRAEVNFIDYITEKRMSRACELLANTDMKIKDVMEQVGYIDLASFTRKFTKKFNISPGCYRNEMRKKAYDTFCV